MAFYKFPSIESPKQIIPKIIDELMADTQTLEIEGTTKLHGTNAAIVFHSDGAIHYQSRSRVLDAKNDNAGFYATMTSALGVEATDHIQKQLSVITDNTDTIVLYGEWCGKGIQKSVALNQVEKMFVIFKIKSLNHGWLKTASWSKIKAEPLIRNIAEIPIFKFSFSRTAPEASLHSIQETIDKVNEQCPFVYQLFGLKGVGEGLVLKPSCSESSVYWFKMKGEKHKVQPPKMKVVLKADSNQINAINEFVFRQVTMERIESARESLGVATKCYKPIIEWMVADIFREEEILGLDDKLLKKAIAQRVRENMNSEVVEH